MRTSRDITGERFGAAIALRFIGKNLHGQHRWEFRCDCGTVFITNKGDMTSGGTKSCGCARANARRKPIGESSFNSLLGSYMRGARLRGIAFELTPEQFRAVTVGACSYCGSAPTAQHLGNRASNGAYQYNGVDRRDNATGYTPNNCVPCCKTCNYAKRTITLAEFEAWIERLFQHTLNKKIPDILRELTHHGQAL